MKSNNWARGDFGEISNFSPVASHVLPQTRVLVNGAECTVIKVTVYLPYQRARIN